jgi:hypothetical protein
MDPVYELSFRPADDQEHKAFEGVLHDFVAREAGKPQSEASSVFAEYDAPAGRWRLSFETSAALKAFGELWRDHAARGARSAHADAAWWAAPVWAGPRS